MATKDPLIGLTVTINPDAKPAKGGGKHPYAGQQAQVIGKPPGGRSYWLQCGAAQVSVPLADFTVTGAESATQAAPADNSLPLAELVRSKTNRHIVEDEALLEMAATMKVYGVLQPLLVRRLPAERLQDTFIDEATRHATHEIIAGERRFMAAGIAGLRRVPVLVIAADNTTAVVLQLIENLHREDLNPLDEARGIQQLVDDFSMTREEVAESLRKSRTHVFESLRLLNICPEAIAALKAGTLNRSVALLVAQRPTPALQVEFTKKVLTSGPDGGPLSYRSAKDLAQRNYMTDLTHAPFALDNSQLLPQVGSCTQCPKRTGANPELWDKAGADVCTDTACFADKKEAHYDALKAEAHAKGRKIITGREARELMPTEGATPKGYILLDRPKKGGTEPMREVLGQEVPQGKVVLIETPTGGVVEAVPVRAAGEALQAKGAAGKAAMKATNPTKDELQAEYQTRWRGAAIAQIIEMLKNDPPASIDLPEEVAYHYILTEAREAEEALVRMIFDLPERFTDTELEKAARKSASASPRLQLLTLMMLAATVDVAPRYQRPPDEAKLLDAVAWAAHIDTSYHKATTQDVMKEEAAARAAESQPDAPADKAKPALKPKAKGKGAVDGTGKTSQAEVMAGIAQAMQTAETPNYFIEGQTVKLKSNVKGPAGGVIQCKDHTATILSASGGRKWVVTLLDPWPFPGTDAKPMELTVDYTELEAADAEE